MVDQPKRDDVIRLLQEIVRNDATYYAHHEPRRWDGRKPSERGGTIWLTPKELATGALRALGAGMPDALAETLGSKP